MRPVKIYSLEDIAARYVREKDFHNKIFSESTREKVGKYYSIFISSRKYVASFLSANCNGKRVLEYGCGEGSHAFTLSQKGAIVTGIDISDTAIDHAGKIAGSEQLKNIDFCVMNAEHLEFKNNTFDLVCGTAILHHLNLEKAYSELSRVLKSSGQAIFMEPLGHNPFINAYRKLTPAIRTVDEHPLMLTDIKLMSKYFLNVDVRYFYLLTLFAIPFRNTYFFNPMLKFLEKTDNMLFSLFPFLRRYAWYVVINISNPRKA